MAEIETVSDVTRMFLEPRFYGPRFYGLTAERAGTHAGRQDPPLSEVELVDTECWAMAGDLPSDRRVLRLVTEVRQWRELYGGTRKRWQVLVPDPSVA
jgi:hypothetical protein